MSLSQPDSDARDFDEAEPEPNRRRKRSPSPAPQFHGSELRCAAGVNLLCHRLRAIGPLVAPETEWRGAADRGAGERGAGERGPLLSSATSAAVNSAFNALAHTVLVQNARTLEDLVREMLRPMLKTWLDDNLPGLVERLVRAEIERVARGR